MYIPMESRFQEIRWLQSFGPKRGDPLYGYVNISGPRVPVDLVNDVVGRLPRLAVALGHIKGYPGSGAEVLYGIDDGVLYWFCDEETDEEHLKYPRVYPWVSLRDVVERPEEITQ
jgi:hypothetical protein